MSADSELRFRARSSETPPSERLLENEAPQERPTKCGKSASCPIKCTLKLLLFFFCFMYVVIPFVFYTCLWVRQQVVFLTFVNIPPFLNPSNPEGFGLNCPKHFYPASDPCINLDTWYIQSSGQPCTKDFFPGKNPIVLY